MITDNQRKKMDALVKALPDCDKAMYLEIAEYATALGYSPTKAKTTSEPVVFAKTIKGFGNRRLCKISPPNPEMDHDPKTNFALSFYATTKYTEVFHEGVRVLCESRKSRRTHEGNDNGCGDCDKCTGYFYTYTNGKTTGCCHDRLIEIPHINLEHLDEIKRMMKVQHEFWTRHLLDK